MFDLTILASMITFSTDPWRISFRARKIARMAGCVSRRSLAVWFSISMFSSPSTA
jgi:hypothetical protein